MLKIHSEHLTPANGRHTNMKTGHKICYTTPMKIIIMTNNAHKLHEIQKY